jgi:hypothetical protein
MMWPYRESRLKRLLYVGWGGLLVIHCQSLVACLRLLVPTARDHLVPDGAREEYREDTALSSQSLRKFHNKGDGRLTRLGHLYQHNSKVRLAATNRRLPWLSIRCR